MAKIGIITYHFAGNYGAVLQCYALNTYLNSCGHSTYVINCITEKQDNNNSLYRKNDNIKSFVKNLLLFPFHKSRKLRFDRYEEFRTKKLNRTSLVRNSCELKTLIEEMQFDYVISGSDQVFNPNICDFEPTFLFPFQTSARKIGYAVSIGKATVEQLSVYGEWIKDFSAISAREESAAERLDSFVESCPVVVDPVFLLDRFSWESICSRIEEKYVLGYYINTKYREEYIKISKRIAKERGLKLVIVDARISKEVFRNTVITNAGPKEFVELFLNAEFVCTDSFHGTSYSILLEKPFICFEPHKDSMDTRKTNLCKAAGIENRIFYLDAPTDVCFGKINYEQVRNNLLPLVNSSKDYLKKVLL